MSGLNNLKRVVEADPAQMLSLAWALPEQSLDAWERGLAWKIPAAWSQSQQLMILGMGGSAIGADLLTGFWGEAVKVPIAVNRTYNIPKWVGPKTLVLVCSYSGNTEETISAAHQARAQGARIAVLTSGGKLARWAKQNRLPLQLIPTGLPPRTAVGYMAFVPLGLLMRLKWIKKDQLKVVRACTAVRRYISNQLDLTVPESKNPAKKIAQALKGRLPILYGAAQGWEGVVFRWRTQLEENAKTIAFHHIFPEATHNEISGWVHPEAVIAKSTALFLSDRAVHPRTRRRMEFTRKIIAREGARTLNVTVPGPDPFARMLSLVALGDFVSIYLAILYGEDPTPVVRVEALKKHMKNGSSK